MVIVVVVLMLFFASSVLGAKMIQKEGQFLVNFKDTEFIKDIRVNQVMIKDAYMLQDDIIYVPLKKIVLTLNEGYQYSKKDNWVVVNTSQEKFKMLLNSSQYFVGKEVHNYKTDPKQNEVKPIFINGRIYAPLQFVEEIFSIKQVGKTLYIDSKTNSLEVETDIQEEVLPTDETEQPLANTIDENNIDADETEDKTEESTSSERTTSTLNSSNTTKKKNKKKTNNSTESNTTVQEQQNSMNTEDTDNTNESENNSENINENVNDNESENNSENINDNESENNSESNSNNEAVEQEITEPTLVDQENTPPTETNSELN